MGIHHSPHTHTHGNPHTYTYTYTYMPGGPTVKIPSFYLLILINDGLRRWRPTSWLVLPVPVIGSLPGLCL